MEFFLKWKGYPESENSWEPKSNLSCSELLQQYMIKHKVTTDTNNLAHSEKSSLVEQADKEVSTAEQQRKKKKSKPSQHQQATTPKSNFLGKRKTKARVKGRCARTSYIHNKCHVKKLKRGHESQYSAPKRDVHTLAQVTPVTLSVREDPRLPTAAGDGKTVVTDHAGSDEDDDVQLLYVEPPRIHGTQSENLTIQPTLFSSTDAYRAAIARCHALQNLPTASVPAGYSNSPGLEGFQRTDLDVDGSVTDSSVSLSQCSSPLFVSDSSFTLRLSPSSTVSSSAGESEDPIKSSTCETCLRTSPDQSPITSNVGSQKSFPPHSDSKTKHYPPRHKKRSVLDTNKKQHINRSLKATRSNQSIEKKEFSNRRGRMGPVPRRRHYQNLSSSLQAKASKDPDDSSALPINGSTAPQSPILRKNHFGNNKQISLIFKFRGICKQVFVHKRNVYSDSEDSDTDSGTTSMETSTSLHYPSKRHKALTDSHETNATPAFCNSLKKITKQQHITDFMDKKDFSSSRSSPNNGLCLVHANSSVSNSGLSNNPLHFHPLQGISTNMVPSQSMCCDSVSSLASVESVKYKQVLLDWQFQLNSQRGGTDDLIFVENEIDRAEPPKNFTYICSNIYGDGVPDPNLQQVRESLCGCQCYHLGKKCGPKAPYCCSTMAHVPFAYTLAGKVCVTPGTPIYECNWKCSCPGDCVNRVVQHGRKIPLCIFRTSNNRGWGVRTLQSIKANTFVTEYVGEVITSEEAEKRGELYDEEGETYLFDLDFDDDHMFTIDAKNYGNISHFFNHSVRIYIQCTI